MKHSLLMFCFLATAAHAVDSVTVNTAVDSGGYGVCKVAVERVGD
jgi:hypothetical protein